MKGVFIFLAEGFEDVEALAPLDILRRGGVDVKTVSVTEDRPVLSSHGVRIEADLVRSEFEASLNKVKVGRHDMMVFPGGSLGSRNLAADKPLMELMKQHWVMGGSIAAICAAPGLVASQLDPIAGLRVTCYEGCEKQLLRKKALYTREGVVRDGRLITGRSMAHAVEFGLTLLAFLKGPETAAQVRESLLF